MDLYVNRHTLLSGIFIGIFVFLLAPVRTASKNNMGTLSCAATKDYFITNKIGSPHIVPENLSYDPAMEVCYNGSEDTEHKSCCTRHMEKRYSHTAGKQLHNSIRVTSSYLKNILFSHALQYEDYFLGLISSAENRTSSLFTEVYKIPQQDKALVSLYSDLHMYFKYKEVNLHETVSRFFDELFPPVFHNILNDASVTDYSATYNECLMEARQQVSPKPFGESPRHISLLLTRSLSTARTFLNALKAGIEAINSTENFVLEPKCIKALTKMEYCSHCEGYVTAKPCRSLCLNVMRGCLANIQELDFQWNRFVDSLVGLTTKMKGTYNIEDAMGKLDSKISEAMLYAMDNGPKFYSQVISKCGHPKVSDEPPKSGIHRSPISTMENVDMSDINLHTRLELFMRNLQASKGFFHNLADTICSQERYSEGVDNERCWTGQSIGRYTSRVVPVNLDAQVQNNPEMRVHLRSTTVTALIDRLANVNKQIQRKVADPPQSDQAHWLQAAYDPYAAEEQSRDQDSSDLGSGSNSEMDDEDYQDERGSGSGSGNGPYGYEPKPTGEDSDVYIVDGRSKDTDGKDQGEIGKSSDNNAASSTIVPSIIVIPLLLVLLVNG